MTPMFQCLLLFVGTLAAGILSAVTGFGGAAILLPLLISAFGPLEAIPILTVAQLLGNLSRVWFNRRQVDLQVVKWFALGTVPAAVAGGLIFSRTPASVLTPLLGLFLLAIVAYRRIVKWKPTLPLRGFAPLGAVAAFLSAMLGSVGPLMAPFFLYYGLVKGAYIGTEALATVVMHVTKIGVYAGTQTLSTSGLAIGGLLGIGLLAGSYIGTRIVDRLSPATFIALVELTLVFAGVRILLG